MGFLSIFTKIPWFIWAFLALLALWVFDRNDRYDDGFNDGKEAAMIELRKAEKKVEEVQEKAIEKADKKAEKRAEAEAEIIDNLEKKIQKAEAKNENALDAIF